MERVTHRERHTREPWSLPVFGFLVSISFVLAAAVDPSVAREMIAHGSRSPAEPQASAHASQSVVVSEEVNGAAARAKTARDPFTVSRIESPPAAREGGVPDAGTAQAIARAMTNARGWGAAEYRCLVALWDRESRWNVSAHNVASGAYGIPQALPGSKMASAGSDWRTNPTTQITWGLSYISARYQTPCGAWASSQERGWY